MEVTLTNRDLLALYEAAKRAADLKVGLKLAYALAKNLKLLEGDCEALTGTINQRRQEIVLAHCLKGDDGQPVVIDNEYQFTPEGRQAFEAQIQGLQQEANDLLASAVTVDLHRVSLDHFPTEIEPWVLRGLLPMLDEDQD